MSNNNKKLLVDLTKCILPISNSSKSNFYDTHLNAPSLSNVHIKNNNYTISNNLMSNHHEAFVNTTNQIKRSSTSPRSAGSFTTGSCSTITRSATSAKTGSSASSSSSTSSARLSSNCSTITKTITSTASSSRSPSILTTSSTYSVCSSASAYSSASSSVSSSTLSNASSASGLGNYMICLFMAFFFS